MKNFVLSDNNFLLFAMQSYVNSHCLDINEFYDDLKKIKYIKKHLNRYLITGELKERAILNHLILFYNVFKTDAATKILFYKFEKKFWPILKTFLVYLNYMPEILEDVSDKKILSSDINLDNNIIQLLRNLKAYEKK